MSKRKKNNFRYSDLSRYYNYTVESDADDVSSSQAIKYDFLISLFLIFVSLFFFVYFLTYTLFKDTYSINKMVLSYRSLAFVWGFLAGFSIFHFVVSFLKNSEEIFVLKLTHVIVLCAFSVLTISSLFCRPLTAEELHKMINLSFMHSCVLKPVETDRGLVYSTADVPKSFISCVESVPVSHEKSAEVYLLKFSYPNKNFVLPFSPNEIQLDYKYYSDFETGISAYAVKSEPKTVYVLLDSKVELSETERNALVLKYLNYSSYFCFGAAPNWLTLFLSILCLAFLLINSVLCIYYIFQGVIYVKGSKK